MNPSDDGRPDVAMGVHARHHAHMLQGHAGIPSVPEHLDIGVPRDPVKGEHGQRRRNGAVDQDHAEDGDGEVRGFAGRPFTTSCFFMNRFSRYRDSMRSSKSRLARCISPKVQRLTRRRA